jgi:hypothetical protein
MTHPRARCHVVCRVGDHDPYAPTVRLPDSELRLAVQASGAIATERVHDSVWPILDSHGIKPLPLAIDLYRASAAVYAADARVSRDAAFDRWTRDLVLHLPVSDVPAWERVSDDFVALLEFLTGDRWDLVLRSGAAPRPAIDARYARGVKSPAIDAVSLLSGGLDSFVGALDGFASQQHLLLVSHIAQGSARFSSPAQDAILPALVRVAGHAVVHLKISVSPPNHARRLDTETTQRSRSIIFMGLGVLVASAFAAGTPLTVPENGFISLNVPLTYGRLGSLSTRTTHPYTLERMRAVLAGLGIPVPLLAPYRFTTKGQMLLHTQAPEILKEFGRKTISCARPNDQNATAARRQEHCGYCVPCIVRRAAMHAADLDDPSEYRYDVHQDRATLLASPARRKDVWAFEMALARAARRADLADVLRAGPLAGSAAEVNQYVEVYRAGLDEVSRFLLGRSAFGDG